MSSSMPSMLGRVSVVALALAVALVVAPRAEAQSATPPKSGDMHAGHHAAGEAEEAHEGSGWKELDAFHDVMSAGWHPAMKDSLAPARAGAPKLVAAAKAWTVSKGPGRCETPAMRTIVSRLVPETEAVQSLVARKAADAAVKAAMKTVHDTYHAAEALCKADAKPVKL